MVQRFNYWRGLFWYAIGFISIVAGLLAFNWWVYGIWIGPHILIAGAANYRAGWSLATILTDRRDWAEMVLVPFIAPIGWLAVIGFGACCVSWSRNPSVRRIGIVTALIVFVAISVTTLILLGSGTQTNPQLNGGEQTALVLIFPLALFALLPLPHENTDSARHVINGLKPQQLANLLRWFAVWFIIFAWILQIPWGASQWGPRILLPCIPPLILWGFFLLASWSHAATSLINIRLAVTPLFRNLRAGPTLTLDVALAICTCMLIIVGLVAQIYGLQMIRHVNTRNHHITTTVAQSTEHVIVTDTWIAPPLIAPLFYDDHLIFIVDDTVDFDTLIQRLQAKGIDDFYYLGDRFPIVTRTSRYADQLHAGEEQRFAYRLSGRIVAIAQP